MNAIIIEDEKLSADHLNHLLKKTDESITVIAVFDSVRTTVEAFQKGIKADLLFVDIHLGDGLSFDIFEQVKIDIPIIFTTAYDEFAIRAFKLNSIDYLLKPVGLNDLKSALEKFTRIHRNNEQGFSKNLPGLLQMMGRHYKRRFMVRLGENIVSVKAGDIAHFLFEDGIVVLTTHDNHTYPVDFTLDQVETMVDPTEFFRINRKVIVSINAIRKTSPYFNSRLTISTAQLSSDHCIVSRERVGAFKEWLGM